MRRAGSAVHECAKEGKPRKQAYDFEPANAGLCLCGIVLPIDLLRRCESDEMDVYEVNPKVGTVRKE